MDQGLGVYEIVLEGDGEEEVARRVGEDGFEEGLAVLEERVADVRGDDVRAAELLCEFDHLLGKGSCDFDVCGR